VVLVGGLDVFAGWDVVDCICCSWVVKTAGCSAFGSAGLAVARDVAVFGTVGDVGLPRVDELTLLSRVVIMSGRVGRDSRDGAVVEIWEGAALGTIGLGTRNLRSRKRSEENEECGNVGVEHAAPSPLSLVVTLSHASGSSGSESVLRSNPRGLYVLVSTALRSE
jgi:hypothetical protein